jgi:UDP-N-acetylglucosamine--N-acetylmuramyl-(pentapeptide) pyrophosphoryl-undecaprenol N-acetylglucosamine transferase
MKVILTGGGTMGSVSPLMGIYEELKVRDPNLQALWLGTKSGPEKEFVEKYDLPFRSIIAGKIRQYFSLLNLLTPLQVVIGFFQSLSILRKFKPDIVLTAGSFVAVPVIYAAWFLKIPRLVHQQDLQVGLANKLMAKVATKITVSLEQSLADFPLKKAILTGNPVRQEVFKGSKEAAVREFKLQTNLPTILILGGGTGAQLINEAVLETVGELVKNFQVIHLSGKDKAISGQLINYYNRETLKFIEERYREYEFLNQEIFDAYALADLVVCRSGFSTLTELAVLNKPALLIPIPGHQEINAQYFAKNNAVKILSQNQLTPETFLKAVTDLMDNLTERQFLVRNISKLLDKQAAKHYVDLIFKLVK